MSATHPLCQLQKSRMEGMISGGTGHLIGLSACMKEIIHKL